MSLETIVSGREFMLDSISQLKVDSVSSAIVLGPMIFVEGVFEKLD